MSRSTKANRRTGRAFAANEFEPQETEPETRARLREKDDAGAWDESGGPLPQDVEAGEPPQAQGSQPGPAAPAHSASAT
jgi:hypothetical protein